MNQQTVLESRRVVAIVDELIEDMELLAYLPGYLISFPQTDLDHMSNVNGTQMGRVYNHSLRNFFDVENKVQGTSVSPDEAAEHHAACRKVLDTFRATGYGLEYAPNTPKSEAVSQFVEVMKVLRTMLHHKFNTTVEEERQKLEILHAAMHREADASADVEALKREFTNEKLARRQDVQKKDAAIMKLQEELQALKETATADMAAFEAMISERNAADTLSFETEETKLHSDCKRLTSELATTKDRDSKEENTRRHDRQKRENKVQTIIDVYDTQMTERNQHEEHYKKVEKELDDLRELHSRATMEEETEAQRQRHNIEMTMAQEEHIKVVQSFYRSYMVRVALTRKKKKGGKK